MKSSELIQILEKDGWYIFNIHGSHHQFRSPINHGKVTIPHPKTELPVQTVKNILKQAGIKRMEQ
jgi:predicted RNA binding protein YcfA (HicA-like mRNA interferase family)